MSAQPKVSVIVLTYNSAGTVAQALDSVLGQQCGFEYEILIGDDGSSDGTTEILRQYESRHKDIIRLFLSSQNRGVQANYYDCMEQCRADLIADCAADDYWSDSNRLQRLVDALDSHPDAVMVHSDWTYLDISDGKTRKGVPAMTRNAEKGELIVLLLSRIGAPAVHLSTAVYRRSSIMNYYRLHRDDIFRERSFGCEDLQLLVALSAAGPCIYLPGETLVYRVGHSSITSESDPAKAATFSIGALRLRLLLRRHYNLEGNQEIEKEIMQTYHFALSMAITSGNDDLVREILAIWRDIPRKHIKTALLRIAISLPGGPAAIGKIKRMCSR